MSVRVDTGSPGERTKHGRGKGSKERGRRIKDERGRGQGREEMMGGRRRRRIAG